VHHSADKGPPIAVFLNQMNPVFDALWAYYYNFPPKPSTNLSSLPFVPRTIRATHHMCHAPYHLTLLTW
jgi:hypothetical protein